MFKKIPTLAMWLFLAVVVIAVPLACSSSSDSPDANSDKVAADMTSAG
jgi:hypothetical protein